MNAPTLTHAWADDGFCTVCGSDGSSSLTGGSACEGPPRVDVIDFATAEPEDEGTVRERGVPLSDCFPEPDDYAAALASVLGRDGEYWTGGGAAPLVCVSLTRPA